jgi:hypothetical protein
LARYGQDELFEHNKVLNDLLSVELLLHFAVFGANETGAALQKFA